MWIFFVATTFALCCTFFAIAKCLYCATVQQQTAKSICAKWQKFGLHTTLHNAQETLRQCENTAPTAHHNWETVVHSTCCCQENLARNLRSTGKCANAFYFATTKHAVFEKETS